ncbi:uncharacterized protein [Bemisia tabaci]|uniref:uncharacterized protein n=1 Tax=Bemisia tabaci TaxID=7038 RepID=UPI003B28D7C9
MRFYTYIFILVVTRSISNDVYCELGCDNSRDHVQTCQAYCNSVWGRAPLLNKPYSHGACFNNDCVCKFNTIELQPYADQCAHRSVWGSVGSNKKFAERAIKEKTIRMDVRQRFDVFKKSYGKKYSSKIEEQRRFAIFNENLIKIEKLMATRKGSVVYGVGPYTDWTSEEYMKSIGVHYPMSKTDSSARLQPRMLSSGRYKRNRSMSSEPPFRTPKREGSEPPYQSNYYFGRDPQGPVIKDWRVPAHLYPPYQSQVRLDLVLNMFMKADHNKTGPD